MITIKDYAKSRGISYEAVRQSIKRHKTELSDHISKQGRTQYLDETAVIVLDNYRNKNTVSVFDPVEDQTETVEKLKNQIILLQNRIIELQNESVIGIEAQAKLQLIESQVEELTEENRQLQTENRSYQRTIFGLYKKVKS